MKLSIIIPVYNTAMYLDDCLRSVVEQPFKDVEIICVNDGSTDGSADLLNKWHELDSRIKVITVENGGSSKARNLGLEIASGEYVGFVDSDDFIYNDMYVKLISAMDSNKLDVIGCSYFTDNNEIPVHFSFRTECVMDFKDTLSSTNSIQSSNDLCFVWRYLIRKKLLDDNCIRMNEKIRIGEDMIFMMHVISFSRRVMFTNEGLYHYRTSNNNSLMHLTNHKPYLEESYSTMYFDKKALIQQYDWDSYTSITFDLARYTILVYLPYLFKNRKLKAGYVEASDVRDILRMPMIRDAFNVVGFKNIFSSNKEYLFYLAEKFMVMPIVIRVLGAAYLQ